MVFDWRVIKLNFNKITSSKSKFNHFRVGYEKFSRIMKNFEAFVTAKEGLAKVFNHCLLSELKRG